MSFQIRVQRCCCVSVNCIACEIHETEGGRCAKDSPFCLACKNASLSVLNSGAHPWTLCKLVGVWQLKQYPWCVYRFCSLLPHLICWTHPNLMSCFRKWTDFTMRVTHCLRWVYHAGPQNGIQGRISVAVTVHWLIAHLCWPPCLEPEALKFPSSSHAILDSGLKTSDTAWRMFIVLLVSRTARCDPTHVA